MIVNVLNVVAELVDQYRCLYLVTIQADLMEIITIGHEQVR